MSTQASRSSSDTEAPLYRKPQADVFTVLLVIALLGLILASTVLWMVMGMYEYKINGAPSPTWSEPRLNPVVAPLHTADSLQDA